MIYMVWMDGDELGDKAWFFVYGTRKAAMQQARSIVEGSPESYPQGVKHLKFSDPDMYFDNKYANSVVVQQRNAYYHGA